MFQAQEVTEDSTDLRVFSSTAATKVEPKVSPHGTWPVHELLPAFADQWHCQAAARPALSVWKRYKQPRSRSQGPTVCVDLAEAATRCEAAVPTVAREVGGVPWSTFRKLTKLGCFFAGLLQLYRRDSIPLIRPCLRQQG